MSPWLISVLAASALFLAFLGARSLTSARSKVSQRLEGIRNLGSDGATDDVHLTAQPLPAFWQGLAFLGWVLPNLMTSENLECDLIQAGYRRREARGLYVGAKIVLGVLGGAGVLLAAEGLHMPHNQGLLLALGAAITGFYIPNLWVSYAQSQRRQQITCTLPDALDLMVICVEAGQGLNAAILKVAKEMRRHAPVLSDELQIVNQEIRVGLNRAQALRNFALRTGVEEARALAAVLIQCDRLGTSIGRALRVHAQSLRTRRRQRAEEAARKTAVKLIFPLVLCIFPALLVVILAPAMIQLVRALMESSGR